MEDLSLRRALALPLLLTCVMLASAAAVSQYSSVSGYRVFWPYVSGWAAATLLAVLIWAAIQTVRMGLKREDGPILKLASGIQTMLPMCLIPALIFPIFLGGYTWAKASIPFIAGYPWESTWADADYLILGDDAWRLAHSVMLPSLAKSWTFFYAVVWGLGLVFIGALITVFADRRFTAVFYTAMMLSWLLGGFVLAYGISAAGPVFAHLVDPSLAHRFEPLRSGLLAVLGPDDIVLKSQRYLAAGMESRIALKGSGVSAMPSMHIATVTIIALAARNSRWIAVALIAWMMTFFGSVYLGYHYAVDAPVAAAVAGLCWRLSHSLVGTPDKHKLAKLAPA